MTSILGVATGVPDNAYSQDEILERFLALQPDQKRQNAVRAIFKRAGVSCRHAAVNRHFFEQRRSTQERNDVYMQQAVPLGERTLRRLLEQTGCQPQEIDDLIVVSCTGFQIPGLDLHLAARLGMRPDLHRTCVLGMGCYGAFPGLLRAYEAAQHGRLALVLALELCSLHLQLDTSAESAVAAALFADGAGAALVGSRPKSQGSPVPRLVNFKTYCDYATFEHMSFTMTDEGFRMYLSSYVPDLLTANIDAFVDCMLGESGLSRDDVAWWGIHPGSRKIVEFIRSKLGVHPSQVESAFHVLQDYGNMSSATILFVLDYIQSYQQPEPGAYGVLMAFGPGLTMEGIVLQW